MNGIEFEFDGGQINPRNVPAVPTVLVQYSI